MASSINSATIMRFKYPRTPHVHFSPGGTNDDGVLENLDHFIGKEIVVTEKMDGENATLYPDGYHARSIDSPHHESRTWIKNYQASIGAFIMSDMRICGENMFARHSIEYNDLESYFYGFSVWHLHTCMGWEFTLDVFKDLKIVHPKVLYHGEYNLQVLVNLAVTMDITKSEGFVVRNAGDFDILDFQKNVCKWVRPGHVQTDEHWMHRKVIPNKLRTS